MSVLKSFKQFIKNISEEREIWQVAFRKKNDIQLYKGNGNGFILIPNDTRYWRADPFVFKYKNRNYIFAEMYDRKNYKAVIGVAKLKNNKCGKFSVCLDLPHHLSYPCVFENNEGIFMIPECSELGETWLYKCDRFPYRWEKCKLIKRIGMVDTTPVLDDNNQPIAYYSSLTEPINGGNDNLYGVNPDGSLEIIYRNNFCCRCAGHLIKDEKLIRPIQDDDGVYGNSLFFSEVINNDIKNFKEQKYLQVFPPNCECGEAQISVSLTNNKRNHNFVGLHTYNCNEDYEVIDLLVERQSNILVFQRNKHKLFEKYIKKLKR